MTHLFKPYLQQQLRVYALNEAIRFTKVML